MAGKEKFKSIAGIVLLVLAMICVVALVLSGCSNSENDSETAPVKTQPQFESLMKKGEELFSNARQSRDLKQYRQAETVFLRAVNGKDKVNALAALGELYVEMANLWSQINDRNELLNKAKTQYEELMKSLPGDTHTYLKAAEVYGALEEFSEEESVLLAVLNNQPDNVTAKVALGICKYNQGNYDKAIELLNECKTGMQNEDGNEVPLIRVNEFLGRAYTKAGKFEKAELVLKDSANELDRLIESEGNRNYWGCPYQALGELYSKTGQLDEVTKYYIKTADLETDRVWVQEQAAVRCYLAGDYENALRLIIRAYSLKPETHLLSFKGLTMIGLASYEEAEKILHPIWSAEAIIKKEYHPASSLAAAGLGHIYIARKKYAEAEHILSTILDGLSGKYGNWQSSANWGKDKGEQAYYIGPWLSYELACLGMAWIRANENKHEKAIGFYDRILKNHPDHVLAMVGKGNSLSGLKKIDEAEKLFLKVLKLYPENKFAIAEMGIIDFNKGRYEQAEKRFEKALKIDGSNYTCPYEGLGLVYLRKGNNAKAKENFEKAISINADIEYKKFNGLAKIYIKEGKIEQAVKLLEKSIENYPYDNEAGQILENLKNKVGTN